MEFGVTATSRGMTARQRGTVRFLFRELKLTRLHHGCCVGGDAQCHGLALEMGAEIIGHPPRDTKMMAKLDGYTELRRPYGYLTRDRHIVRDGVDGLIGAPKDFHPPINFRGQGTWKTIRYGFRAHRRLWIVYPDGTFEELGGTKRTLRSGVLAFKLE